VSIPKNISSFDQLSLDPKIHKAIEQCGYKEPTPIQAQSIPSILDQKDVIACAQTGSGKTASFVLPALQRLCEQGPSKKSRILILTPTRELANQITKAVTTYGKLMKVTTAVLVGGMPYHHQIKDLARGADIVVATPGRLLDHLEQRRVDLSGIEMLVLDEADRMLDMGFIDDVQYIAKLTPSDRQTLLFSATIDKELANVVRHLMKHPVRIDLSNEKISTPKIRQELYKVSSAQQKTKLLKHFLLEGSIYKAIIFSATKIHADKLAQQLRDDGFAAGALHGDLRQNVRNRTLEQLRNGKIQYLVATDVAARGIDVRDITHVFNYDLPRFSEDYVHRIGRTGRAGKEGVAISFVGPADGKHLQSIERYIGQRIKFMPAVAIDEAALKQSEGSGRKTLSIEPVHQLQDKSDRRKRQFSKERGRDSSYARRDKGKPKQKFGKKREKFADDYQRDEKPRKRFDFDKRDAGSERGERRDHKRFDSKKRDDFSRSDERKPRKRFDSDRRDDSFGRDDRKPRKRFDSDRRDDSFGRDDRKPRKRFDTDRRDDSFGRDDRKPRKRFDTDRRDDSFGRDDRKPRKRFDSDKPNDFQRDKRKSNKRFSSDKPSEFQRDDRKPKKRFSPDKKRDDFQRDERKPNKEFGFGKHKKRSIENNKRPFKKKRSD
jgi:superfamily II DNA/RNA helicase